MSLIQEALRRKDNDEPVNGGIPPKQIPPVLTIPQSQEKKKAKGSRAWLVLAASLVVVLVLVVAALGLLLYSAKHFVAPVQQGSRQEEPVSVVEPGRGGEKGLEAAVSTLPEPKQEMTTAEQGTESAVIDPDERPPLQTPPARRRVPFPASREAKSRSRPPSTVPPRAEPRSRLEKAGAATRTSETRKRRTVTNGVKTEPVVATDPSKWPKLSLLGVMAQDDPRRGSAIVNNIVVEVGEEIEGARLLQVQRNGVLLRYNGETQFVRVGQSTF